MNVNQATKEYLERYVEKKTENSKNLKESQAVGADQEDGTAVTDEKDEPPNSSVEDSSKNGDKGGKETHDFANFGIVTDEDKQGDQEALEKLTGLIEERLKTKPLPPPPPPSQASIDGSGNSNLELPSKSRDGDSDVDTRSRECLWWIYDQFTFTCLSLFLWQIFTSTVNVCFHFCYLQMKLKGKMRMRQLATIKLLANRTDLKQSHPIGVEVMTGEAEIETENEI